MSNDQQRYNVLMILTDQLRYPRFAYGAGGGILQPLKDIIGFADGVTPDSEYADMFPGMMALRQNAVVLRNHTISASACVPSRATIMTGQYGTRTGVTQTNGLFKSGDAHNFPWLDADGIPTIGDWFRAAGYSTHYFGKWHVSNPEDHSLDRWGFSDWELSYPEPHGAQLNNLGTYRDFGFADLGATFLRRKGLGWEWDRNQAIQESRDPLAPTSDVAPGKPFFAVVSFTNPHDIATYPTLPRMLNMSGQGPLAPVVVPEQGAFSPPAQGGTMSIELNPRDFTSAGAHLPPEQVLHDPLGNKPDCQFDYAYKLGLALAANGGSLEVARAARIPFQITDDPAGWSLAYLQYYAYLTHVVDQHIATIMRALDESGLRQNTIVLFTSDHGDFGVAHNMMIEKWHSAYEEVLQVPVVVNAPYVEQRDASELRAIDSLTSHVDVAPTLLGLAGVPEAEWPALARSMADHQTPPPFAGANLAPLIEDAARGVPRDAWREPTGPDGAPRDAVLFITDDTITEPLPYAGDTHNAAGIQAFEIYLQRVEDVRGGELVANPKHAGGVERLRPGAVAQPNHVRCLRTREWKLVRYFDPRGNHDDQWELYSLRHDAFEMHNLLVYDGAFPTVVAPERFPDGLDLSPEEVAAQARRLQEKLTQAEQDMLTPVAPQIAPE